MRPTRYTIKYLLAECEDAARLLKSAEVREIDEADDRAPDEVRQARRILAKWTVRKDRKYLAIQTRIKRDRDEIIRMIHLGADPNDVMKAITRTFKTRMTKVQARINAPLMRERKPRSRKP